MNRILDIVYLSLRQSREGGGRALRIREMGTPSTEVHEMVAKRLWMAPRTRVTLNPHPTPTSAVLETSSHM